MRDHFNKRLKLAFVASTIILFCLVLGFCVQRNRIYLIERYQTGIYLIESGDYLGGIKILSTLRSYKDSSDFIDVAWSWEMLVHARMDMVDDNLDAALSAFLELKDINRLPPSQNQRVNEMRAEVSSLAEVYILQVELLRACEQ